MHCVKIGQTILFRRLLLMFCNLRWACCHSYTLLLVIIAENNWKNCSESFDVDINPVRRFQWKIWPNFFFNPHKVCHYHCLSHQDYKIAYCVGTKFFLCRFFLLGSRLKDYYIKYLQWNFFCNPYLHLF